MSAPEVAILVAVAVTFVSTCATLCILVLIRREYRDRYYRDEYGRPTPPPWAPQPVGPNPLNRDGRWR